MKPVDEVAEVVEQLAVVFQHEVVPAERAVLRFWAHEQEVEAPDVSGNARVFRVVPKYPHSTTLRELAVLVVQILYNKHTTLVHVSQCSMM